MLRTSWTISTAELARGPWRGVAGPAAAGATAGVCVGALVGALASWWLGLGAGVAVAAVGVGFGVSRWAAVARRLTAIGRIVSALEDAAEGERRAQALSVEPDGSAVVEAWNRLLEERAETRAKRAIDEALEAVRGAAGGGEGPGRALAALSVGVVLVDAFGAIGVCNAAASAMLGGEGSIRVGSAAADVLGDAGLVAAVREVSEAGGSKALTVERGDGAVISAKLRALRTYREGREVLISLEDVTRQRVAAEARGLFVAHAAHELRSPLTNIRLYVEEAIDAGAEGGASVAQALNVIQTEARRLERVVEDMLGAAEVESGSLAVHRREVRLRQVFEELRDDFRLPAESKGLSLAFELPPKYPVGFVDREKLALAVHNLVGNAIKYTPSGGRVRVVVTADDGSLEVAVSDTGIGIAEEDAERVFERFYRADDERVAAEKGTGLGLFLSREIARRHGGDVTVESRAGAGSTFTLRVPIGPGETPTAAAA